MRDRPHPQHKLEWPGGVVPEWAKPQQNQKRRGKGRPERQGGSSPSKRERLQKVMAQSGHGSRRNIEILIAQGHITINGQIAKLGDSVGPGDKVKLDGRLLLLRFGDPLPRVLLYHKNTGEIVTRDDPEKRPTVFDRLPKVHGGRWVSVGRLDFNTEGLLIFTTSGELANRLTHPRFEVEREYAVRTVGELTEEQQQKLLTGVDIDGESCKFDSLEDRGGEGTNHWYHVVLREGKNREVRRMMEAVGLMVSRLMRVRFGSVELPGHIKRGMMREMDEEQVQNLLNFAGMNEPPPTEAAEEEDEEDEFDNIGNRAPAHEVREREREVPAEHDNIGNRAPAHEMRERELPAEHDDIGNRGSYDLRDRPEPGTRPPANQRRAHGGKPFAFGKKRGAQGQGGDREGNFIAQPQGQRTHGKGPHGPGQGHGHPKHKSRHRKHGQHGNAQPNVQGQPQAQGPQGPNPNPSAPAGQPGQGNKPGRGRRHKNRNRNRGPGVRGDQQPQQNDNNES